MSPIKMLLGPPWTDTGEPGAFANHDCFDCGCEAFERLLPEGQETKSRLEHAASNEANCATRLSVVGILRIEITPVSFRFVF
jgi:hypothetical protein